MPSWCFKSLICKETTLTGLAVTSRGGGGKRTYCYVLTFVYRIHCYILTFKVSVWALNINIYIHNIYIIYLVVLYIWYIYIHIGIYVYICTYIYIYIYKRKILGERKNVFYRKYKKDQST